MIVRKRIIKRLQRTLLKKDHIKRIFYLFAHLIQRGYGEKR